MTVSEFIASFLSEQGVTDTFGIPGGVILDLIYAFNSTQDITPHLCYHEQSAGFAANGYAQSSNKLGVAYATKGPGFTNLITAIADAYYDSIPVLYITAHTASTLPQGCRLVADQDMDTCSMINNITKYAKRVDCIDEIIPSVEEAVKIATDGRKGPVFLDIAAYLFKKEISINVPSPPKKELKKDNALQLASLVCNKIKNAQRPIILVGDGVNLSNTPEHLRIFIEKAQIPVLSSRYSHNIAAGSQYYYGYVGSHGIRYANFILSKTDLIIALGNRLYFPPQSESFKKIVQQATFLRFDVDKGELLRHNEMPTGYEIDLESLMPVLAEKVTDCGNHLEWCNICNKIYQNLLHQDMNETVLYISQLLKSIPSNWTLVSDVGNNEFWVSQACVHSKIKNRTLYSKSFGALGNALGKAIGAYYATQNPVIVFIGDQGLQINLQELQYIVQHKLPIAIVVLNNFSSGMIKDREEAMGYKFSLHTTLESGYSVPILFNIAHAYGIIYKTQEQITCLSQLSSPLFIEVKVSESLSLAPSLPKGRDCQDMEPSLEVFLYNKLNEL
ncbi:thiamine pyrophosphate-binding protein [Phocaeicola plebeius]|uniref:thiamine pyrophosphate-binding protein n=1 Tax=Phocaeicola plebeius TaxID=310297 RepID=UPI0026EEE532|nr:thiamine pyrophosphate-binding protein [Phocaeicola plebeius]